MIGPVVKSFRDKRTEHPEPEHPLEQSNCAQQDLLESIELLAGMN